MVVALVLVLTGSACWSQFRGDASHSGLQPFEFAVSAANVGSLEELWHATSGIASGPAAVTGGVVYVGMGTQVKAYDAAGSGCAHQAFSCQALWSGNTGGTVDTTPAVGGGRVYVSSRNGKLSVFDAGGVANCTGTPRTCQPLWTATLAQPGDDVSSPVATGGFVYISSYAPQGLSVFDAAGVTNCGGTPRVCSPLWTGSLLGPGRTTPVVAGGRVAVSSPLGNVFVFDAAGNINCTGVPKLCQPVGTAITTGGEPGSPAIVNGVMYVVTANGTLHAFDASASTGCSGAELRGCARLWIAATGDGTDTAPAIANGTVYLGTGANTRRLFAYDAAGAANCSGAPKVCTPRWRSSAGADARMSPVVANGVVYLGTRNAGVDAFDAAGATNCSGAPRTCDALWTSSGARDIDVPPVIVGGVLYVATPTGLTAYSL